MVEEEMNENKNADKYISGYITSTNMPISTVELVANFRKNAKCLEAGKTEVHYQYSRLFERFANDLEKLNKQQDEINITKL